MKESKSKLDVLENKVKTLESKIKDLTATAKTEMEAKDEEIATLTNKIKPEASLNKCDHYGCFLRQPNPPASHFPSKKSTYIYPPDNIRLLPYSVPTYQDFRSLHADHECEDCSDGSLFSNYHEIVHYPDPGPCGGTSGSQVKSCPNHPNAEISIKTSSDPGGNKTKHKRKTFKCNFCAQYFSKPEHLTFHMNRLHGQKML